MCREMPFRILNELVEKVTMLRSNEVLRHETWHLKPDL